MSTITFLNSTFLFALGAALLPLLIHLLSRRKAETIYFSNVAFLRKLQTSRMRRIKIRQILLLILRTLIVAFAVLAFSRPTLKGTLLRGVGKAGRTSAVILLDDSYSMGHRTRNGRLFDLAKERIWEALDLLGDGDEVALLSFSDRPRLLGNGPTHNLSLLQELVSEAELQNRTTDVEPALREAGKLLEKSTNLNKELYLFTDLTENGWRGVKSPQSPESSVYVISFEDKWRDNLSIDSVDIPDQIVAVGKPLRVRVKVTNYGEDKVSGMLVHLYLGGRRVKQSALNLKAGESGEVEFSILPERGGKISGYAEIEDDGLSVDNRRYFAIDIPEEVKVILVGGEKEDTYFLEKAFDSSDSEDGFIESFSITEDQLSAETVKESDVVIFCNVPQLSSEQLRSVQDHVRNGGGLVICLGGDIDLRFYNEELLPKLLGVKLKSLIGNPGDKTSYYSFGRIDFDHPLLKGLARGEVPHVYAAYDAVIPPETNPIIRYQNGSPALFEREKVLLLTTAIDLDWTDLPLRGLFVPLFYRTIQYLATDLSARQSYLVGQAVERRIPGAHPGGALVCETPLGERITIPPGSSGDYVWQIGEVEHPGFWRIFSEEREVDSFVVNVETAESNPRKVERARLESMFGKDRLRIVPPGVPLKEEITRSRYGRELWRECLLLALALMAAEMTIARTTRREVD